MYDRGSRGSTSSLELDTHAARTEACLGTVGLRGAGSHECGQPDDYGDYQRGRRDPPARSPRGRSRRQPVVRREKILTGYQNFLRARPVRGGLRPWKLNRPGIVLG
jgi:hypothetical protein